MKNRTIITALIVLLIIAVTAAVALADEGSNTGITFSNVLVNGKDLSTLSTSPVTLKPLQNLQVSFKVKNALSEEVTKITSQIIDENGNGDGYSFSVDGKAQFHLQAGQESSVQTITTTIPADVQTGNYSLTLIAQGYTLDDQTLRTKQEFTFSVKREKAEIVVTVDPLASGKDVLTCSATTTLTATITDTGSVTEDDVITRVMDGSTELFHSGDITIASGQSKTLSLPVTINGAGKHTLSVETGFNYINNVPGSTANTVTVVVSKNLCIADTITPQNTNLVLLDGSKVDFTVKTNEDSYSNNLVWTVNNVEAAKGKVLSYTFSTVGTYTVKAALNEESKVWKVTVADKPLDLLTFGLTQSQIDQITDPSHVNNFVLTTADATIKFSQSVDLSNTLYIGDVVKITSQSVAIDSATAAGLNKPATVTLKKVDGSQLVSLYRYDGFADASVIDKAQACSTTICSVGNQQTGSFTFAVTGFSTYIAVSQKTAEINVPSEIDLDNTQTNSTVSTTFTVQNLGTTETIKNIVFDVSGLSSSYNAKIVNAPSELAPQESKTVTLQISSNSVDSGKKLIGNVKITSSKTTKTIPAYVTAKTFLVVDTIRVNGKTDGDLSLESNPNTIEVSVRNDYKEDLKDVYVKVKILNVNGNDLSEESDALKINTGETKKVTLNFDLSTENVDKQDYTVEITATGKGNDDTKHETTTTQVVNVDVKSHNLIISKTSLSADTLSCAQQYSTVSVAIKNLGSNDEDNVELHVKNSALNLDLNKKNIKISKFSSSDNEYTATFTVDAGKAMPGSYNLAVEVYRNGALQTTSTLTLKIESCATAGNTVLTGGSVAAAGQDQLTQQLQQQLNARLGEQPVVKTTLRDSGSYTLLLGGLVVLVFVALVLAMALIWRKK